MNHKTKILFLCTGNSCRSQMAEGWARNLKSDSIEPYSAGIETHGLNPNAVRVMAEAGVDISGQRSKNVGELQDIAFDYVVTVCGHAHEHCPIFLGKAKIVHVGFDDPPKLAANAKTEEERLAPYRRVRDEIKSFVHGATGNVVFQGSYSRCRFPICRRIQLCPGGVLRLCRGHWIRSRHGFEGGRWFRRRDGPYGIYLRCGHGGIHGFGPAICGCCGRPADQGGELRLYP